MGHFLNRARASAVVPALSLQTFVFLFVDSLNFLFRFGFPSNRNEMVSAVEKLLEIP